jgi:AMP-binding enzyme
MAGRLRVGFVCVNAPEQDVLPFDRFLMSNPLYRASGFSVLHFHVRASEVVLLRTFNAEGFLSLIEQHRITRATLNPTTARFVLDHPAVDRYDVSSVRSVSYGGMPMPNRPRWSCPSGSGVFPPTSARPNRIDALLRS